MIIIQSKIRNEFNDLFYIDKYFDDSRFMKIKKVLFSLISKLNNITDLRNMKLMEEGNYTMVFYCWLETKNAIAISEISCNRKGQSHLQFQII